jgi:hypothetical protein
MKLWQMATNNDIDKIVMVDKERQMVTDSDYDRW